MKRKGQIWIETVLYTLIAIALIGIILAIATPSINARKDRIVIEQSVESLNVWNNKIGAAESDGPGNRRTITELSLRRGELYINSTGESIVYVIQDLTKAYSEQDVSIPLGAIVLTSKKNANEDYVILELKYNNTLNITYGGEDIVKKFTSAPTPYSFSIENMGFVNGSELFTMDIQETSRA